MKKVTRILSVFLAVAMLVTVIQGMTFTASAAHPTAEGNYIFNRGSAADVRYVPQRNTYLEGIGAVAEGDFTIDARAATKPNVTKFGSALTISAQEYYSATWTQIPMSAPISYDFSKAQGIGMYVKMPSDAKKTVMMFRIINQGWSRWAETPYNNMQNVTLIDTAGNKTTADWSEPFINMQGFEGYVFIPFSSLTRGTGVDVATELDTAPGALNLGWNIEIWLYGRDNPADKNIEYCFDNIGFYSNVDSYRALSEAESLEKNSNYIANRGHVGGVTLTDLAAISYKVAKNATRFGDAISITPQNNPYMPSECGSGWVSIPATVDKKNFDFSAVKGVAMYVKFPEKIENTRFQCRILQSVDNYYHNNYNVTVYYAAVDGNEISQWTLNQWHVGIDHQGFEGYLFIPWESMNSTGLADKDIPDPSILASNDWRIEIGMYELDFTRVGQEFYFDEIGFYSSPEGYVRESINLANVGNEIFNTGDASKVTYMNNDGQVVETVKDATPYGDALALSAAKTTAGGWAQIPATVGSGFDFSKAAGLAMYVDFPAGAPTIPQLRYINKAWAQWQNADGNTTIQMVGEDGAIKTGTWSAASLLGYKGFVFVPFNDMAFGGGSRQDGWLDAYNWNIETQIYSADASITNYKFIIDEVGYYSDIDSYFNILGQEQIAHEFISDACRWQKLAKKWTTQFDISSGENAVPVGEGIKIAPNVYNAYGYMTLPMVANGAKVDKSTLQGVAFYANIPDLASSGTVIDFRVANNNRATLFNIPGWEEYFTIDMAGNYQARTGGYAQLSGFEGFIFLPFRSLLAGNLAPNKQEMLSGGFTFEIGFSFNDAGMIGVPTYIDKVGVYTDMNDYVNLVRDTAIDASLEGFQAVEDENWGTIEFVRIKDDFNKIGSIASLVTIGKAPVVEMYDKDSNPLEGSEEVSTGAFFYDETYETTYFVVKYGDLTGDGVIDVRDIVRFKRYLAGAVYAEPYLVNACSVDGTLTPDATDLTALKKVLIY